MDAAKEIICFCDAESEPSRAIIGTAPARRLPDFDAFRAEPREPLAFVIQGGEAGYVTETLRRIRQDPDHATALVFIDGALSSDAERAKSDGPLPRTHAALSERISETQRRAQAIVGKGDDRSPETLLLEYMWLRPGFVLEPVSDWTHARRYRYPVLEALDRTASDPDLWLGRLRKQGYLEPVALKDRQRECDFCHSAHLAFGDVCPKCRGIEIDQQMALHCFTCGLIAPESRFMQAGQRVCPKCQTRLRQIGTDYDRPMETSACQSCDHIFMDGEKMVRCMVCEQAMRPEDLRVRPIQSWRLSGMGRLAAQGRSLHQEKASGPRLRHHLVSYETFFEQLSWLHQISRSNAGLSFAVMGLYLENLMELNAAIGPGRTATVLDTFIETLCQHLADVDLCARSDEETLWILLPNGDRKRVLSLQKEIKDVVYAGAHVEGAMPQWKTGELVVNAKLENAADAGALIQRVRDSLGPSRAAA